MWSFSWCGLLSSVVAPSLLNPHAFCLIFILIFLNARSQRHWRQKLSTRKRQRVIVALHASKDEMRYCRLNDGSLYEPQVLKINNAGGVRCLNANSWVCRVLSSMRCQWRIHIQFASPLSPDLTQLQPPTPAHPRELDACVQRPNFHLTVTHSRGNNSSVSRRESLIVCPAGSLPCPLGQTPGWLIPSYCLSSWRRRRPSMSVLYEVTTAFK